MSSSGLPPPPPPLHAVHWEHTLLMGDPSSSSWFRESPPPSLACCALGSHADVWWGSPPSSTLGLRTVGTRGLPPSPLLPACRLRTVLGLGLPFFGLVLAARWVPALKVGSCTDMFWGPPCAPAAHRGRAAGWGVPPSFPPLTAARVKRVRPFGGSPLLVLASVVASHGERVLQGFVPLLLCFHPFLTHRGPIASLATGGPHIGSIPLCCLRHQ